MVFGQIGQLEIVQNYVMVEFKRKPGVVLILHHLVEERIAVVWQKKLWSVI